jgi:hypothetical protein
LTKRCSEKFGKKLIGRNNLEDALRFKLWSLDNLTHQVAEVQREKAQEKEKCSSLIGLVIGATPNPVLAPLSPSFLPFVAKTGRIL